MVKYRDIGMGIQPKLKSHFVVICLGYFPYSLMRYNCFLSNL